ncbi:hypothetical protein [Tranquillimonas alkanivorans]|nr:hypothetical protein [Tranquillimonas alkanivorans]
MDFEERIAEFTAGFDYENDPAVTLVDLVRSAGEFLARITGPEAVDQGMKFVIGGLALTEGADWREALEAEEHGAYAVWPLGQMLHDLSAYAHYGIDLTAREHETEDQIAARLRERVERAEEFLALCPLEAWLGETRSPQLETTVLLARNRWALDHDRPVEPEALAVFGGVKMSRMRNMLAGKNATFHRENGLIPAHEAKSWLEGRDSFFPSIWRSARPVHNGKVLTLSYVHPLFVPQARDGSIFHPGLERRNGFTVGEKGREFQVSTFEDALRELQEMPIPAWRRPSPGRGGWGIVRGTTWARMNWEELDSRARSEMELRKLAEEGDDEDV